MDPSMMNAQVMAHQQYVFYQHAEMKRQPAQFQPHQMYPNVPILASAPQFSRPNSACSQPQPPTLYSNVPGAMTPMASPQPVALKPSIMLETEIRDREAFYPQTPPLSSSGSSAGSPSSVDVLQTPVNPMFSGLDGLKSELDAFENLKFDFAAAATSPPLTPMYTFQAAKALSTTISSPESCPSLSPSPPPYARSVASSEQEVDFCDPRNLTNPALATAIPTEDVKVETFNSEQAEFSFDNAAIVNDLFEDQSDLESLVHLDQFVAPADARRPRAATGSSVLSLGHESFISDDLSFCDENFTFPCLPTPTESEAASDFDSHRNKRVKKSPKEDADMPQTNVAASGSQSASKAQASHADASNESKNNGSGSDGSQPLNPPPANRRGRKQSLTEDPSKTFVCDLCNRRFRRQEHLKRHYRSLHTQEKPFECNECGKKFSRSDNLAQHARTHGSGAIVMDLLDDHEAAHMFAQPLLGNPEDYRHYGKVLFQVAAEMPGSASESSEDDLHHDKKKRKRVD